MKNLLRSIAATLVLALCVPACDDSVETGDEQNVTASTGSFETFTGEDGQTYFQLLAKNGERILRSEGYTSLSSAKKGITSVKKNGKVLANFKVLGADNGEFYFNLVATNGEIIGTSELYTTESSAKKAVDAVIAALQSPTSAPAEAGGPRFETFKGKDGKTYFRLRAGNGQIVLQSQGYSSKSKAESGVKAVKANAVDSTNFQVVEGASGQHTFRLVASNGEVIGRGEMYASKSGAFTGASTVHRIVRELTSAGETTDAEIKTQIEKAADGLTYISESDFPFTFVSAPLSGDISEEAVRAAFADLVDNDADADKPLADLAAMTETWDDWKKAEHSCQDKGDPESMVICTKMRNFEAVLEANLSDLQVFYFGANGEPGHIDGTAVSVFIVGRSPEGNMVGVWTIAIWT
jgi:uncharacterized protein YegP (UPF0339 family)